MKIFLISIVFFASNVLAQEIANNEAYDVEKFVKTCIYRFEGKYLADVKDFQSQYNAVYLPFESYKDDNKKTKEYIDALYSVYDGCLAKQRAQALIKP